MASIFGGRHYARRRMQNALWQGALVLASLPACKKKEEAPSPSSAAPSASPASDRSPTLLPADTLHKLGETAEARDYKLTLVNVQECKVKYYFKPRKGNIKLGAEVVIAGTGDKQVPVNPFYGKLTDAQGETYTSTFAGCEPELKSRQVAKGDEARGFISFEIPEKASGLKFTYAPFIIGGGKQDTTFDLGR